MNDIIECDCLLADLEDYADFNSVYAQFFDDDKAPARAAYQVARLPKDAKTEIKATAIFKK